MKNALMKYLQLSFDSSSSGEAEMLRVGLLGCLCRDRSGVLPPLLWLPSSSGYSVILNSSTHSSPKALRIPRQFCNNYLLPRNFSFQTSLLRQPQKGDKPKKGQAVRGRAKGQDNYLWKVYAFVTGLDVSLFLQLHLRGIIFLNPNPLSFPPTPQRF